MTSPADRVARLAGLPIEPQAGVDLWSGGTGWRPLSERVEAFALSEARPLEGEGERVPLLDDEPAAPLPPLVERPRYVVRARDVFLAGQRALLDDSDPARPRVVNDVALLPPPFFDQARPLSAFPHEFRMNPWVRREGERLHLDAPPEPVAVAEPVVAVSSTEIRNYGSWLFRVVPKLLTLGEVDAAGTRALLVPTEQPWMREILSHFAPGRRIVSQDPTRLHHLADAFVPSLPAAGNVFPKAVRDRLAGIAAAAAGGESAPERLYVSRRRFSQSVPRRVLVNEGEVAETFAGFGFREIFPEEIPLAERIALFARAVAVAGPTGSGLFNTIFCKPKSLVIEMEPHGEFRPMHGALYRSMGFRHAFLRGTPVASGTGPQHPDWTIAPQLCREALVKLLCQRQF